jgi:hypothetical protein
MLNHHYCHHHPGIRVLSPMFPFLLSLLSLFVWRISVPPTRLS